jgi:hypothetical protein
VPLLELIVRNIARYPQSATSTSIRYQPVIRYLDVNPLSTEKWKKMEEKEKNKW